MGTPPAQRDDERGFALALVLVTFVLIGVIGLGALSVVTSDLHGAAANELAMQALSVAEAGLNFGVARLAALAADPAPSDERYAGEPEDLPLQRPDGSVQGVFRVAVRCVYPSGSTPPACRDDARTSWIDERDLRMVDASGFVPGRPGRARRQIEAVVRRYGNGRPDSVVRGICGRDGVELGPDTAVIADVGSNGDVVVDGPRRQPWTVGPRLPVAPSTAPVIETVSPDGSSDGLTGAYTWRVTFIDAAGHESGGSPPTPVSHLAAQHGHLTGVPLGGAQGVRRRIYRSRQDAPYGPWYLVGDLADRTTQEFTDTLPDEALRWRLAGSIDGGVTAAGTVRCSRDCAGQVGGRVQADAKDVVCPAFLVPPAQPGGRPAPNPVVQTSTTQTFRWSVLHVPENEIFTIETLSHERASVHIHVNSIVLERNAALVVTGPGTVYFHVSGPFVLRRGAAFGVADSDGHLLRPSDRVQVLSAARDGGFFAAAETSIRWEPGSVVSASVVAPDANIVIDRAAAISGGLYGRFIRIAGSSNVVLDPTEGLGSELSIVRPSPYQYVVRWYDNPNPSP